MDAEFWLERWREGRTHFHQTRVTPLLQKYWPGLDVPAGGKVLVPLCGKSLDMVWLAAQGHEVLGVELAPLAVEQFFAENELRPVIHESSYGRHYVAGNIRSSAATSTTWTPGSCRIASAPTTAPRWWRCRNPCVRHMCATSMASCRRPGAGC